MAAAIPLAITVATSASTIAIVGATIAAVGAISGSKDLAKIGGLIGLAGGVISMSGAMGAEGLATSEAAMMADDVANGAGMGAEAAAGATDAQMLADDIANGAASGEAALAGTNAADVAIQGAGSANETASTVVSGQAPTQVSSSGVVGAPDATVNAQRHLQGGGDVARMADDLANGYASAPIDGPAKTDGILNSIMKFGKENKEVTAAVLGGVSRAFSYPADKTRAEAAMMKAKSDVRLTDAQLAELERQRIARGYVPGSVGFSLNDNANLYAKGGYSVPVRGLLNSSMG